MTLLLENRAPVEDAPKLDADWRWMLGYLNSHGGRATNNELRNASSWERGVGITVHSRAADIRRHFTRTESPLWLYCDKRGKGRRRDPLYWLGPVGLPDDATPPSVMEGATA